MSIKNHTLLAILLLITTYTVRAEHQPELPPDSLKAYYLDDFVITTSVKETNDLKNLPGAVSVISPKQIINNRIESLPDLSATIPNFFIPSYGSKVSTPIYIRGMGARYGAQTVSMYVDNVPSFNPSAFDFEFQDIQRVEVLRGAQGTLYGRNAIGGIVNVYTLSPLTYQGTRMMVNGGNLGQFSANLSNYSKLASNLGLSVAGYYKRDDGYFVNNYDGSKMDNVDNAGGKAKLEWEVTPKFKAVLFGNYDYFKQGGFPYMLEGESGGNTNDPTSYMRKLATSGLSLNYKGNGFDINATTGYQLLRDDMQMDQDYSPLSVFDIRQQQKQRSISQEVVFKSANYNRYKWVVGAFGFYDHRTIDTPVTLKEDAVASLQGQMDAILGAVGAPLDILYTNDQIKLPGYYTKPAKGVALFHQSTLQDLFGVEGLTATAGIRLDYEHTSIDFFTESIGGDIELNFDKLNASLPPHRPPMPAISIAGDTTMQGKYSKHFWEVLPKVALKYDLSPTAQIYLTASKGYKTGGYNEQSFSKILQSALMESLMGNLAEQMPGGMAQYLPPIVPSDLTLEEQLSYDPELSWTYELGGRYEMLDNRMSLNYAFYYSHVKNIQIIQLTDQGQSGRIVTNAGKSNSKGVELSLRYNPTDNFTLFSEYGFADARFRDYVVKGGAGVDAEGNPVDLDYTGNAIPFAPRHTLTVGATYRHACKRHAWLDYINLNVRHTAAGKIYWTEENDAWQSFYGLTNAGVTFEKGLLSLELWGKNILSRRYHSFYFRANDMNGQEHAYIQKGDPARYGATLRYTINR